MHRLGSLILLYDHANRWVKPSYTTKTIALDGMALATVIPQPAYSPRTPRVLYIAFAVSQNDPGRFDNRSEGVNVSGGRRSSAVWIADLTVSAG